MGSQQRPPIADLSDLLHAAASVAATYRESLGDRHVNAQRNVDELRAAFGGPLPASPAPAEDVLRALVEAAGGGLVATAGPRYFGFVIGGALDAATAAEIVTTDGTSAPSTRSCRRPAWPPSSWPGRGSRSSSGCRQVRRSAS